MRDGFLKGVMCSVVLFLFLLQTPAFAADEETSETNEEVIQTETIQSETLADKAARKKVTREKIDGSVRDFFDKRTSKVWQYMLPSILLRTGLIYEQYDETNRVLRRAGFKLWDAQIGFKGELDEYPITKRWHLRIHYKFTGQFAGDSVKVNDAYGDFEIASNLFSARMRLGNQKVPFLESELVSDAGMIFYDRPQYARPYGAKYMPVTIGLKRMAGLEMRLGFLNNLINLHGGLFTPSHPKEEDWETSLWATRATIDTGKLIHDKIRFEAGGGYVYQKKLPQYFENSRYAFSADARFTAFGAFVGGEWVLQIMDDGFKEEDYRRYNFKNNITRQMGYMVYAGYSFPKREYEIAVRYQWFDPDDTNIDPPQPQNANQAARWITVGVSWWPIDLVRVMLNYTHKQELEADYTSREYTQCRLMRLKNDEVVFMLQMAM